MVKKLSMLGAYCNFNDAQKSLIIDSGCFLNIWMKNYDNDRICAAR